MLLEINFSIRILEDNSDQTILSYLFKVEIKVIIEIVKNLSSAIRDPRDKTTNSYRFSTAKFMRL